MSERPFYLGTTSTFEKPYAKQTSKQVQIRNLAGDLLYIVNLKYKNDLHDEDLLNYEHDYLVYVDSFISGHSIIISQWFDYASDAEDFFNLNVDIYKAIAIASSKGERSMDIFKDKVKYHTIKPDCCKYCAFAKPCLSNYIEVYKQLDPISIDVLQVEVELSNLLSVVEVSSLVDCINQWQCTNPNLFKLPDIPGRDMSISAAHYSPVYPTVQADGICKDFARVQVFDSHGNANPYNRGLPTDKLKAKVDLLVQEEFRRLQREYENDIELVDGGTAENDV